MVGMAAVLAGTKKAPLTAILLLFELTRDYRIAPLMAAVGLSVAGGANTASSTSGSNLHLNLGLNVEKTSRRKFYSKCWWRSPLMLPATLPLRAGLS